MFSMSSMLNRTRISCPTASKLEYDTDSLLLSADSHISSCVLAIPPSTFQQSSLTLSTRLWSIARHLPRPECLRFLPDSGLSMRFSCPLSLRSELIPSSRAVPSLEPQTQPCAKGVDLSNPLFSHQLLPQLRDLCLSKAPL